ncbi:MAG TPA: c-type cytochrome [Terriglobales bacterium]|nr:c-type cytochrome [Terriglobales bacterium]
MHVRKAVWMFAALFVVCVTLVAQAQQKPTVKHGPMTMTSPASGAEMFKTYCAVCHGTDGSGNGPAAESLKTPPANLTMLSKNNGGKFPAMKVMSTIRGESDVTAHGTREMPVWGHLFWTVSGGHESEVQQRVANLTKYIESLQAK